MSDNIDAFLSRVNGTWYLEHEHNTYKFATKQGAIDFYFKRGKTMSDEDKTPCKTCKGSGSVEIVCKRCKGSGWVGRVPGGEICCGGWDDAPCPDCDGSGEVDDE